MLSRLETAVAHAEKTLPEDGQEALAELIDMFVAGYRTDGFRPLSQLLTEYTAKLDLGRGNERPGKED